MKRYAYIALLSVGALQAMDNQGGGIHFIEEYRVQAAVVTERLKMVKEQKALYVTACQNEKRSKPKLIAADSLNLAWEKYSVLSGQLEQRLKEYTLTEQEKILVQIQELEQENASLKSLLDQKMGEQSFNQNQAITLSCPQLQGSKAVERDTDKENSEIWCQTLGAPMGHGFFVSAADGKRINP